MSEEKRLYTGLDIGSTSVKVIIAEVDKQHISILGVGNQISQGIKRGVIVDLEKTVESINGAVKQAEEKAGISVQNVIVGVPDYQLDIIESHGVVEVEDSNHEITDQDVEKVINQLTVQAIPAEKQVMSVLAEEFVVDGFNDINDPRGMVGVRLELYGLVLSLPKTIIQSIVRVVEKAGLSVSHLVLQSLALSSVALSPDEKRAGAIVIDLGGGQTTASATHDNKLKYVTVDPEGGNNVTNDIAIVLNISTNEAQKIKHAHGFGSSLLAKEDDTFSVMPINKDQPVELSEKYLSEIIEARFIQIIETIKPKLEKIQALDLPSSIVVSGGSAMLPGVKELFEEYFDKPVKIYTPNYMGIRHSTFSTALGLINYISERDDIYAFIDRTVTGKFNKNDNRSTAHETIEDKPTNDNTSQSTFRDEDVEVDEESLLDKIKNFFTSFFE